MQRAREHRFVIVPITIGAIFFLLFLLFRSLRFASLIILVLPFASIGGVFIALWHRRAERRGAGVLHPQAAPIRHGAPACDYGRRQIGFRPVMMTATVAALRLVPFLFATGPGSEVQRPLAIVVIGGLITSTLLTLVVVPSLYRFFDDQPAEKKSEPELAHSH